MSKGNKELKQFNLNSDDNFIVYLREIIFRTDKCLTSFEKYLDELKQEILNSKTIVKINCDYFDAFKYGKFVDLISHKESYLLNLIGDQQQTSISYIKFRRVASSKKILNIKAFSEYQNSLLKDFNCMRNWINHVPESLLTSEIELIKKEHFLPHSINPLKIYYYETVDMNVVVDLYDTSKSFFNKCKEIFSWMIEDYSSLVNQDVEIHRIISENSKKLTVFEATKLSANIQGIKGNL